MSDKQVKDLYYDLVDRGLVYNPPIETTLGKSLWPERYRNTWYAIVNRYLHLKACGPAAEQWVARQKPDRDSKFEELCNKYKNLPNKQSTLTYEEKRQKAIEAFNKGIK
jgi:hypothetical protein